MQGRTVYLSVLIGCMWHTSKKSCFLVNQGNVAPPGLQNAGSYGEQKRKILTCKLIVIGCQ